MFLGLLALRTRGAAESTVPGAGARRPEPTCGPRRREPLVRAARFGARRADGGAGRHLRGRLLDAGHTLDRRRGAARARTAWSATVLSAKSGGTRGTVVVAGPSWSSSAARDMVADGSADVRRRRSWRLPVADDGQEPSLDAAWCGRRDGSQVDPGRSWLSSARRRLRRRRAGSGVTGGSGRNCSPRWAPPSGPSGWRGSSPRTVRPRRSSPGSVLRGAVGGTPGTGGGRRAQYRAGRGELSMELQWGDGAGRAVPGSGGGGATGGTHGSRRRAGECAPGAGGYWAEAFQRLVTTCVCAR